MGHMTAIPGNAGDPVTQLRSDFRRWVIFEDAYSVTGRRRKNGQTETLTGRSAEVLRCHLAHAEFEDVLAEVAARSA